MPNGDDMRPAASGARPTYGDFLRFPDNAMRHEVIDGEHDVTPSPSTRHQRISGRLYLLIGTWLETHPVGALFFAPFDVVFSNFDIVEPDLLYRSNTRAAEVLTALHVAGVPELVIEIGSPGTRKRDQTLKRLLDERMGVTEYWVVDPDLDTIRVYRRTDEGFDRLIELSAEAGDVLASALLTGLEIPLARVFAWGKADA